jgi:hypothetical protein
MKNKKPGPAPKSAEQKRNRRISVYLSDTEYAELTQRVPKSDLCNYIRAQVFEGTVEVKKIIPDINLQAYGELGRVASNLNQIARKLHSADIIDLSLLQAELHAFRVALIKGLAV